MSHVDNGQKAEALLAIDAGGGVRATAAVLGIPAQRISDWRQGIAAGGAVQDIRERFNSNFIQRVEGRIDLALDAMPGKMEDANFAQLCTGVGILIDKRQLLLGAPTTIVQHIADPNELRAGLVAAALDAGITYNDALEAAMAIAEETGDRELQRLLPTLAGG